MATIVHGYDIINMFIYLHFRNKYMYFTHIYTQCMYKYTKYIHTYTKHTHKRKNTFDYSTRLCAYKYINTYKQRVNMEQSKVMTEHEGVEATISYIII